ncbi:MAG TPA: hypothetical protein VIG99_21195 [Myxococcaceae bacterium]|jgi:hypothetical protein
MADPGHRWFLALGGAALLVSASLGGLALLRKRRAQAPSLALPVAAGSTNPLGLEPDGACGPQRTEFHPLPGAEAPPVILWAAGAARLFIDEQPAFSSPEKPRRFTPGEHTVRIEAPGEEPIRTRIRVDPFTPALLHAQADSQLGLSLVRFGAGCLPCEPPAKPVDLSPVRNPRPNPAVLPATAGHLRHDRWPQAAEGIRRASPADRKRPIFYRLAAITAEDGGQHDLARALLERIPASQSNDLATLLPTLDRLATSESKRRKEVTLARWNKITEWFATLSARYQGDAASPVAAATKRFSQLSLVFDTAVREGTIEQQTEVVRAGEQTLGSLVKELRALKPEDCQLQQDLSAVGIR